MNYYIAHYGIKGQRWGVRRYQNVDGTLTPEGHKRYSDELNIVAKTKYGQKLLISQDKSPRLTRFIAKHNKHVRDELNRSKNCTITDSKGNRVGELELYKESPTSLNVVWVGINDKYQGNGYGQAVMKAAIKYARQTGLRQVTLEVPGTSPDARHIYEKYGFVAGETISDNDDIWGGLTKMRLKL